MNEVNLWGATLWRFEPGEKGTRIGFFYVCMCEEAEYTKRSIFQWTDQHEGDFNVVVVVVRRDDQERGNANRQTALS